MVAARTTNPPMRNRPVWLLLPLFASCIGISKHETVAPAPVVAEEAAAQVEKADEAKDKKKEIAAKTRELEFARLELKIEKQKLAAAARKAQDEVETSEYAFKKAAAALEQFDKVEQPLALAQAQLSLDRATWGMEEDRQELAELQKLYAENQVEGTTKELVIQRSQKKLDFAKTALEHEQKEFDAKKGFELPAKRKDLERAKVEAEKELRDARAEKTRTADENELELRKQEAKLDDLEKEIKELGGTVPAEPKKDEPKKDDGKKKEEPKKKEDAKPASKPAPKEGQKPAEGQKP